MRWNDTNRLPAWIEFAGFAAVTALLMLLLYAPMLSNGFDEKDDWSGRIIALDTSLHPQMEARTQIYSEPYWRYGIVEEMQTYGRARFLYWLLATAEAHLFQYQPALWQAETLLIGALTISLWFIALRRLGVSPLSAVLSALPLIWFAERLWIEKQIAEEPGTLLYALAFALLAQAAQSSRRTSWDWAGLLALILAGWMKESFVLAAPALLLLRLVPGLLRGESLREMLRSLRPVWIAAALLLALQLTIIAYVYSLDGYGAGVTGGIEAAGRFSPLVWVQMLLPLLAGQVSVVGVLLIAPALRRAARIRRAALFGLAVITLAIIPQVILYGRDGRFGQPYYAYPTMLWVLLTGALGLDMIRQRLPKIPAALLYSLAALALLYRIVGIFPSIPNDTSQYAGRSMAREFLLQAAVEHAGGGTILLATPAYLERAYTFLVTLSEAQIAAPVALLALPVLPGEFFGTPLPDSVAKFMPDVSTVDPAAVDMIAVYAPLEQFQQHAPDWFDAAEWDYQRIVVSYPRIELHLRELRIERIWLSYDYSVLVRQRD